jgi:hypothetical protein
MVLFGIKMGEGGLKSAATHLEHSTQLFPLELRYVQSYGFQGVKNWMVAVHPILFAMALKMLVVLEPEEGKKFENHSVPDAPLLHLTYFSIGQPSTGQSWCRPAGLQTT